MPLIPLKIVPFASNPPPTVSALSEAALEVISVSLVTCPAASMSRTDTVTLRLRLDFREESGTDRDRPWARWAPAHVLQAPFLAGAWRQRSLQFVSHQKDDCTTASETGRTGGMSMPEEKGSMLREINARVSFTAMKILNLSFVYFKSNKECVTRINKFYRLVRKETPIEKRR